MDPRTHRESGQAAVETALTMPLAVFLVLGTLQLFLMLHGRILAEYAVYRATRAGSVNQGDCRVMTHSALASLMPAVARTDGYDELAKNFGLRSRNAYLPLVDGSPYGMPRTGAIVWLVHRLDRALNRPHEESFDDKHRGDSRAELQVDMVFWFPLKIPFADWVMSRAFLAMFGGASYVEANPLMPTRRADWTARESDFLDGTQTLDELGSRVMRGQYDFPIRTSYRMHMMTPALLINQACPNSPTAL